MRKRTLGIVLLAGLAISGAGASTAANTMSQSSNLAGYGQATATGATVTDIAYTMLSSDASKLSQVVFKSSTNLAAGVGKTARMTLKDGSGGVLGSYDCTISVYDLVTTNNDITCPTSNNPAVADLAQTGLTVVDS